MGSLALPLDCFPTMTQRLHTHEDLARRYDAEGSSDRAFGLVFAAVFGVVAAWPLVHGGGGIQGWAISAAAAFLLVSLLWPHSLAPLNRAWAKFGLLLQRIVSPVLLAAMFYLLILPIGIFLRLRGRRPLESAI